MLQHPEQMVWELGRSMAPEYAQGFGVFDFLKAITLTTLPKWDPPGALNFVEIDWAVGGKGDS